MSIDTSSDNPEKFAFPDGAALPNSSTMWKPETSRSGKVDDETFRIYMQRTTPSVAGIGLGEIVAADMTVFYSNGFIGVADVDLEWAERPADEEEENAGGDDGEEGGDGEEGEENAGGEDGEEEGEEEEEEEEEPAYEWRATVTENCTVNEDDWTVECAEHCEEDPMTGEEQCHAASVWVPQTMPGCSVNEDNKLMCETVCEEDVAAQWENDMEDAMADMEDALQDALDDFGLD